MAEKTAKKPNILKRIGKGISRFFRDTKGEMKKVVWPSRKQVRNNFIIVVVFCVVMALFIFGLDLLFSWLLGLIINIGSPAV